MSEKNMDWHQSPQVEQWKESLQREGCTLNSLELIARLNKKDGSLLFALSKTDAFDSEGHFLLPYVLFRGAAVVVVPRILPLEGGEPLYLTVTQRRSGHGKESLEFPAGMLDGSLDALGVGVKELAEETGLIIARKNLKPLWHQPLFSSPGLSDESVHFFGVEETWSQEQRKSYDGSVAGLWEEGEKIKVSLKTADEIRVQATSLQTLLALNLFLESEAFRKSA